MSTQATAPTAASASTKIGVRSSGDHESSRGRDRVFTDRVILTVPIVTMGPGGGPVIDMDQLLVMQAPVFFGPSVFHKSLTPRLYKIKEAKAFANYNRHNVNKDFINKTSV